MSARGLTVTFSFTEPAAAKLFIGRVTHAFGLACLRRDERVTVMCEESDYDRIVIVARTLGGEQVVP